VRLVGEFPRLQKGRRRFWNNELAVRQADYAAMSRQFVKGTHCHVA
jgi:hypothetical protein